MSGQRKGLTDLEVRQVQMIKALTVELMNARADERRRIREYVMARIGHCPCCEWAEAYDQGCTCAVERVPALFAEYEEHGE